MCGWMLSWGLLWKKKHIGELRGRVLDWMQDYLKDREIRTIDAFSSLRNVMSGVPQESVLAPIMFHICVYDIQCEVTSYMNLFANDAKLMKVVRNIDDCQE